MNIYAALGAIAQNIMGATATSTKIMPPELYQGAGGEFGVDVLEIDFEEQDRGNGVAFILAKAVIFLYYATFEPDTALTNIVHCLSYSDLSEVLSTYNEITNIDVDKIVVYSVNQYNRRVVAIHVNIYLQNI